MFVDFRTRRDEPRAAVDPEAFFSTELPDAIARNAELIRPGVDWIRPKPATFTIGGGAWTLAYEPDAPHGIAGSGVTVTPGGGGRTTIALDGGAFDDLVHDQQSMMGLWVGGKIGDDPNAKLGDALNWWLVLRAALDAQRIYTPGSVDLVDNGGRPLDLHRTFRFGADDPQEMHEFLVGAGFLHIAGVFRDDEMVAVSADMDRAAPNYEQGDGRSWWARKADGSEHLVRMQGFDHESDIALELLDDPRFLGLAELSHEGHRFARKRSDNRIEALFKPLGIVAGVSDIGWHKDCGIGRHSYDCCGMTVGISVTGAGPDSGQLHALAGSPSCARVVGFAAATHRPARRAAGNRARRRHHPSQLHDAHGPGTGDARAPSDVQRLLPAPARRGGRGRRARRPRSPATPHCASRRRCGPSPATSTADPWTRRSRSSTSTCRALVAHDWDALATTLAPDMTRRGPYLDDYEGADAYVGFLRQTMPTLDDYELDVARVWGDGSGRVCAELSETVTMRGARLHTDEAIVFDVDDRNRIASVQVFLRKSYDPAHAALP